MHELSLATEIHRAARAAVEARGAGRLDVVQVVVGELSAVEPDLLAYAWEAVVAGSRDAGARIEIEWRPARQVCAACGVAAEREAGTWLRTCLRCGQPLRLEGGDELDLVRLSYTPDEERAS